MALPKWITPSGNLGTVPELDYFQFDLDAYDASGGTLEYSKISGKLPLGIQVITSGKLQGIPVSELTGDQNVEYRFTVRVKNLSTGEVADRSFNITVTNIAPPIITPRTSYLGVYLDGSIINNQLTAIEFTPGAELIWSIKSGKLPDGLTLSSSGLISGYIAPIVNTMPGNNPNWDETYWSLHGWDFSKIFTNQTFVFTVEVFDGVNYDAITYKLLVVPKGALSADNDILTIDADSMQGGLPLTINLGTKHTPIITTVQSELLDIRQGSYLSFNVDAIDLDNDKLQYVVPKGGGGSFDEQSIFGVGLSYVAAQPSRGNLYVANNSIPNPTETDLILGEQIKVLNDDNLWSVATITDYITIELSGNVRVNGKRGDSITQTLTSVVAQLEAISPTTGYINVSGDGITANVGDIITQTNKTGVAKVTSSIVRSLSIPVIYTAGNFAIEQTSIMINGVNAGIYPTNVICRTEISATYEGITDQTQSSIDTFMMRAADATLKFNNVDTKSYPSSIVSVGVTLGQLADEGTVGFDEGKFDQTVLVLPDGISIDINTGWLTGYLPMQQAEKVVYNFEVVAFKRDYSGYIASKLYTLTVLGDLTNAVTWVTPSDLGTIENGAVSDLFVQATSSKNKEIIYQLVTDQLARLPQGLTLALNGLLAGRVSFSLFNLDQGQTTIDGRSATNFDSVYTFTVLATDYNTTATASRTFTVRVIDRNTQPYENLYLKAMMSRSQRQLFTELMGDKSVFPNALVYRNGDPEFGLSHEIKTLFLPGLNASTLAEYSHVVETNHQTKKILFGDIKVAAAIADDLTTKYEVVYIEIFDENTSAVGGPPNVIDLTRIINHPYIDESGSYTIAYPNAFNNMSTTMVNTLGYENKGALPDWMTSKQPNGRVLGFTRAVVLAYIAAGHGEKVAYRLNQVGFKFNQLDFTVDRYQVDNNYSQHFDIPAQKYLRANEVTFDRYPIMPSEFANLGTIDYAISSAFELVNNHMRTDVIARGGMDGYADFQDGQILVFAQQEFFRDQMDTGDYNQGWHNVITNWSGVDSWDELDITEGVAWDESLPVTGYQEHNLDPAIENQRAGIWRINISSSELVTLTFVEEVVPFSTMRVRYGNTYGGTNIYLDPVIKPDNLIPNYSIVQQQIKAMSTSFDGNGTRFFDHRDTYAAPGSNDKYVKFSQKTIFN